MSWTTYPFDGRMVTIGQASVITGISDNTLRKRMKHGMTLQEACDMKFERGLPSYDFRGEKRTKSYIADAAGVTMSTLSGVMYRHGLTPGEAAEYLIACKQEYPYKGRTINLIDLANNVKCRQYSLYSLIVEKGMSAEDAVAASKDSDDVFSRRKAARMICGEIFAGVIPEEVAFYQHSEDFFTFGSQLYRYEIRFASPHRARLTAFFRDPECGDSVSTMWDYEINRNSIKKIGRTEK